jgi:hypothetical protein
MKFRSDFWLSLAPGPVTVLHKGNVDRLTLDTRNANVDDEDSDGPSYQYYKSEKILGQLYRAVDEEKIWYEDIRKVVQTDGPSFWDSFLQWAQKKCDQFGRVDWVGRSGDAKAARSA